MPKFHPTPIIQDCWSSIGDITFYHRGGQCYWKRKPKPSFNHTPARLDQAQVHHRAILAWQQLQHSVQLEWRELARCVPSHRPPYDDNHHISGYNLFVSAYHGFAQLGNEHVPTPQPFPEFPSAALEVLEIIPGAETATIRCRLTLADTVHPERWHLSARIQLTAPGVGCDPGKMRSCMGFRTNGNEIELRVPNPGFEECQVHIRYRLIDKVTGYRNNWS
jgi:hypothetical protein